MLGKCSASPSPWREEEGDEEGEKGEGWEGGEGAEVEVEVEVRLESVRVDGAHANAPVVAMGVGCGSIAELQSCVEADGVFRGSGVRPRKGARAERKVLGAR